MTTTEPTESTGILIRPEIRMPAAMVDHLEQLAPRVEQVAPIVVELAAEMADVAAWLDGPGFGDDEVLETIRESTPYGRLFDLFRVIASNAQAAVGEAPSFVNVGWYDAQRDRQDRQALEDPNLDERTRHIIQTRVTARAITSEETG